MNNTWLSEKLTYIAALKNPSEEITVAIRLYIGDNMMPHEAIYKLPITK